MRAGRGGRAGPPRAGGAERGCPFPRPGRARLLLRGAERRGGEGEGS